MFKDGIRTNVELGVDVVRVIHCLLFLVAVAAALLVSLSVFILR